MYPLQVAGSKGGIALAKKIAANSQWAIGPLADYVGRWDLTWDIEKHKERVAKIEAEKEN